MSFPRIRELGVFARLGVISLAAVFAIGLVASAAHIRDHYQNRDGDKQLSMTDIRGAYHGVAAPSPLIRALERGHPGTLTAPKRAMLLDWLLGKPGVDGARPPAGNPRLAEDYDNLDLGDNAPSEIIRSSCLSCHGAAATDPIAKKFPLEYWDNVRAIAFPKDIAPTPVDKLVTSIHAHSIALASMAAALAALLLLTSFPRRLAEIIGGVMGVALLADFACQWLARSSEHAVWGIVVAGGAFSAAAALACVLIALDACLPRRKPA